MDGIVLVGAGTPPLLGIFSPREYLAGRTEFRLLFVVVDVVFVVVVVVVIVVAAATAAVNGRRRPFVVVVVGSLVLSSVAFFRLSRSACSRLPVVMYLRRRPFRQLRCLHVRSLSSRDLTAAARACRAEIAPRDPLGRS